MMPTNEPLQPSRGTGPQRGKFQTAVIAARG